MNINEFIEKNDIAIVVKANLQEKDFDIIIAGVPRAGKIKKCISE